MKIRYGKLVGTANTLNRIESFVDAEGNFLITFLECPLNITKVFITFSEQFENMTLNRTITKPVENL